MKKIIYCLAITTTFLVSCSTNDDEGIITPATGELSGSVTSNKTIPFGDYVLNGIYTIESGVTVTFDAGSIITAFAANGVDAILVKNGGKLIMNGTANQPIVLTENSQIPGSWGGIIMYGDAPINGAGGTSSKTSEDGLSLTYGGLNPTHNGGSLKYVRVEYAGKKITDGTSEMNSFSFYSVGSGTVLQNLVAYKGADDGFEFYGGTVSATNLVAFGNFDDSFDWQDGWRGQNNSNWYAYQTGTGNYGMEIESSNNNNAFWPTITNITLIREAGTNTEGGSSAAEFDAIQFKKQGNGKFSNIVISGYTNTNATAVRIQDALTNNDQVNTSKIELLNVKINNATSQYAGAGALSVLFTQQQYTLNQNATGANLTNGKWSFAEGVFLIR